MTTVTIKDVWKYYGKTAAVKALDLDCRDGEFLCVLGPSGCGKSSTLRMLAGLEHISAGDIHFGDRRVNDLPPKDRDIAMVFENYALYPHKTVFENMANALRLHRVAPAEIKDRVTKAATLLQIDHLLHRKPQELSGGQKQRVAIGRAIVRKPQVFLFDEPIAHLDAKLRAHMRGELKHLQRSLGTTTIYVTHDQLEALSMADRIAVMNDGILQQFGTPSEIYDRPANEWVASFVGEPPMNFLDATVDRGSGPQAGKPVLRHGTLALPLDPAVAAAATNGVRLGIRPEDVRVTLAAPGGGAAGWAACEIFAVEPIGGDTLVDVKLGDARVLAKTKADFAGKIGDRCWIAFEASKLHVFDAGNGQALPRTAGWAPAGPAIAANQFA
jgi:multiple sugar transport system ATP-binding protein